MSNYTPAMIAKLQAAAPLDLAKAKALASDFGNVSHRSVISKAKHLGLDYLVAPKATKKSVCLRLTPSRLSPRRLTLARMTLTGWHSLRVPLSIPYWLT